MVNALVHGVFSIPTGAGVLPSTVGIEVGDYPYKT